MKAMPGGLPLSGCERKLIPGLNLHLRHPADRQNLQGALKANCLTIEVVADRADGDFNTIILFQSLDDFRQLQP